MARYFRRIDDFQLFDTGKGMIVGDEDRVRVKEKRRNHGEHRGAEEPGTRGESLNAKCWS